MGPLAGLRFIEIGGIGPGPFCGMLLADMGAEVISIRKPGSALAGVLGVTEKNKRRVTLDFKEGQNIEKVLTLCEYADGLFEGFRPGVMERLGLGPSECLQRNPKLVYGRLSGFGQEGPLAHKAGHDINYLATAGILDLIKGSNAKPLPPANLVADYGGGSLYLALGLLSGVLHAQRSGVGQVVDHSLSEGAASLATIFFGGAESDVVKSALTGDSPFYNVYTCKDGLHMSVGSIEPNFYALFLEVMGLEEDPLFASQFDKTNWPKMIESLSVLFKTATRAEWAARFADVDCCVFPVSLVSEVASSAQMKARQHFAEVDGMHIPGPSPRFSISTLSQARLGVDTDIDSVLRNLSAVD